MTVAHHLRPGSGARRTSQSYVRVPDGCGQRTHGLHPRNEPARFIPGRDCAAFLAARIELAPWLPQPKPASDVSTNGHHASTNGGAPKISDRVPLDGLADTVGRATGEAVRVGQGLLGKAAGSAARSLAEAPSGRP